jgi:lysophospholipase L1-like esterase
VTTPYNFESALSLADLEIYRRMSASFVAPERPKLRKWYAALAKREAAPAQIVCFGDSISEGTGASTITRRWQTLLQRNLRSRFGVSGGAVFPYLPAVPATTTPGSPVVSAGTVNANQSFGLGGRQAAIPGASGSLTFTFTGTGGKLLLVRHTTGGIVRIVVDGGTPALVDQYSATNAGGLVYDLGALTPGVHTVVVSRDATTTTGRQVLVEGLVTYDGDAASGIRVLDAARHGANSTAFAAPNATQMAASLASAGSAGLAVIALGTNDVSSSVPASTTQANVAALVTALRAAGFDGSVLYLAAPKGGGRTDATWDPYVAALCSLAAADPDGEFLDLRTRMPDAPASGFATNSLGLFADGLHPSDAGHGYIADVLAGFLSPR